MGSRPSALWIDWARNLRTRTLARRLDVELLETAPPERQRSLGDGYDGEPKKTGTDA